MAIICIAREPGAYGEEMATELSALTGYRNINREYLEAKLTERGFGPEKLKRFDEKKPGLLAALSQERDEYLHYLKTVMFSEAEAAGSCIMLGRGGFAVFKGVPGVVSIFLVAPESVRVERLAAFYKCDARQAEHIARRIEIDREGFHRFFFNIGWSDPHNYDFTVNTGDRDPKAIASIVKRLAEVSVDAEAEAACRVRVGELSLARRIVNELVYVRRVPVHFLEAEVRGGTATLRGVTNVQSAIDAAVAAAHTVPGVATVESAIQIVQDFSMLP